MSSIFSTAVSGMNVAVKRMMNAASNIVNASSTGKIPSAENEKPTSYRPTDIVSVSNSTGDNHFGAHAEVIERTPAYTTAMEPHSPHANAEGLIAVPNVDISSEIVDTMMARIAYEASAKVIAAERENQKTLIDTLS